MTDHTPKVSILVTVYNRESYLEQTLHSIIKSTYTDFEVIVVDDGSTDRSLEIANQVAELDDRIQVHSNKQNLGDYPNRMKAASLARGHYLKYVDSDDIIYPHSLAIMVESMERFPEAALGLSHSMPEDDSPYPWLLSPEQAFQKQFLGRGCLNCGPSGAIIRREAFECVGGFRPEWAVISDKNLWYRLSAKWPTVLLPPGLVWWRRHEGQEFAINDAELVYLPLGYQLSSEALKSPDCPLSAKDRISAQEKVRQHFSRRLLSLAMRKRQVGGALDLFRNSDLTLMDIVKGFRAYK